MSVPTQHSRPAASAPAGAGPSALPVPTSRRWQPLRAGLVDLYYYDDQQFLFHDGRLLLRGNNGAGKSKVLALLLPFLLDGETSGHRMEPDGDAAKKMEWNLLLGGEHASSERTGYSWLELGRVDADGRTHHRTIGFGVKAVRGRGVVKRWFFSTTARVGLDLHLLDATRTALTSERLEAALEGRGHVVATARAYRALVDEAFFGLGESRYAALVDLLIQLRQPQLSRRPSEARLSDALTSALPPLDQAVLSDVAETFRSLEEDRATLARSQAAAAGVTDFLRSYRSYARATARRAAEPPRRAQSRYEQVGRELADAARELGAAQEDSEAAAQHLAAAVREVEVLAARTRALEKDPRHRSVEAVEQARVVVARLERELEQARTRSEQARRRCAASQAAARSARADRATRTERVDRDLETAAADAGAAGVTAPRDLVAGPGAGAEVAGPAGARGEGAAGPLQQAGTLDPADPPPATGPWRRAGAGVVERRRRDLDRMGALAAVQAAAGARSERAGSDVDQLEAQAGALDEQHAVAAGARDAAARSLVSGVAGWAGALVELELPDVAHLVASVEAWTTALVGPFPAAPLVASARDVRAGDLAAARAGRERELADARARAQDLREELDRLERGGHLPPAGLPTRDAELRTDRPGAPLWQVVDLRGSSGGADGADGTTAAPVLDDAARAGLEAALEGAGLLDAWVTPDGDVLASVHDDVVLRALPVAARPARSLADVLVASVPEAAGGAGSPESALPTAAVVQAVLASIGCGSQPDGVWVDLDGAFGTPVSSGSWHKDTSEHLGAGARERARAARLHVVRSSLADADQQVFDLGDALDALRARTRALAAETAALPAPDVLARADAAVDALSTQRAALGPRLAAAVAARDEAMAAHAAATAAVTEAAADLSLPADEAGRRVVADALHRYELSLERSFAALEALAAAVGADTERTEAARVDTADLAARTAEVRGRELEHAGAAEDLAVTQRTVGVEAAALLAELEQVRAVALEASSARVAADEALGLARERRGAAGSRQASLEVALAERAGVRDEAVDRLRAFATTGLLAVALPELEVLDPAVAWVADPAVRLARRVEAELSDVAVDDPALSRLRDRVSSGARALDDALAPDGHRAVLFVREEGIIVDVTFRGRPATVVELEAALAADVAAREELLDSRERQVIETYLVDEVASTLAELIGDAEAQVAAMNAELERRPTSTGMRLHLTWRVREDGPPGLAAARERLLRQSADAWSGADREAVGAFLTDQIRAVRAADPGGAWLDQLTRALDHRAWHRFTISRWQNGQWRSATGPASGGERVLAASVPLFAAASAHYGSAPNPLAPRLIMLDEAFAGVDDTARADYLGLLAAFDLDVVMTSEREWACYPQVPGIGISQLSRLEGVDAVLVTPWRWDGVSLERAPDPPPTAAPARASAPRAAPEAGAPGIEQDGLWAQE